MLYLFRRCTIGIEFRDYPPDHNINISLFDLNSYNRLSSNGININPIRIIHHAAVHYQPRYRNSRAQRFLNAFFEIKESFVRDSSDGMMRLRNSQSSDLIRNSSEVVAVGICISIACELFNINSNRIFVIEASGKRCDFEFEKNSMRYLLESKGRGDDNKIQTAIDDIFIKKDNNAGPTKYGIVSHLPRDNTPVSTVVVDPEAVEQEFPRDDLVLRVLSYYSKASRLSGFWKLSELLNTRIDSIKDGIPLSEFEDVSLDYQNVFKIGRGYDITFRNITIETFFPSDVEIGFSEYERDMIAFMALDRRLIELLESQDYENLLNYKIEVGVDNTIVTDIGTFSINDDGTVVGVVLPRFFEQ